MPSTGFTFVAKNRTAKSLIAVPQDQGHHHNWEGISCDEHSATFSNSWNSQRISIGLPPQPKESTTTMFRKGPILNPLNIPQVGHMSPTASGSPRNKRYSRSHIELGDAPASSGISRIGTPLHLKEVSIDIEPYTEVRKDAVPSPTRLARKQLTEEFDREQSPKRLQKEIESRMGEMMLFEESEYIHEYDAPDHSRNHQARSVHDLPDPSNSYRGSQFEYATTRAPGPLNPSLSCKQTSASGSTFVTEGKMDANASTKLGSFGENEGKLMPPQTMALSPHVGWRKQNSSLTGLSNLEMESAKSRQPHHIPERGHDPRQVSANETNDPFFNCNSMNSIEIRDDEDRPWQRTSITIQKDQQQQ